MKSNIWQDEYEGIARTNVDWELKMRSKAA